MYLTDLLRRNAEKLGDKPAVVFKEQPVSWVELWSRVQKASARLSEELDNQRQEVVAILAPNSIEFIITYLAVVHCGHVALPMDISFKKLEIDAVFNSVEPALTLSLRNLSHLAASRVLLIEDLLSANSSHPITGPKLPPDIQISTLFLSSGTTGKPKAIPNTHANILWDVSTIAGPMGWTGNDSLLITLHLSHRHGLAICLLGGFYHGNTVYLEERFNPEKTMEMLESGKISLYSAVPSIYESLINYRPGESFDLSAVRLFASSSSTLPPFLRRAFKARFGRDILDRYGTSETGSIAIKSPDGPEGFDVVLGGVDLRLESNGEVALKSPGLFPGYYKDAAATRQSTTEDGWWLLGDIGEMNGNNLVLKGRAKERIVKSGYSIYPQEIEWALLQNPAVKEARVIGLRPKDHVDDNVVAFYAGAAGEEALRQYALENLPRSWRPDRYIKLDELPRGRTHKVQVGKLREMVE